MGGRGFLIRIDPTNGRAGGASVTFATVLCRRLCLLLRTEMMTALVGFLLSLRWTGHAVACRFWGHDAYRFVSLTGQFCQRPPFSDPIGRKKRYIFPVI
jgi:hypothetical protein